MSPANYRARYGERSAVANGRQSFFGALVFDAPEQERLRGFLSRSSDLQVGESSEALAVRVPFLNTLLEFRAPR
jgi:hypothetical protein